MSKISIFYTARSEGNGLGMFRYVFFGKAFYGHGGFNGSILAYNPTDRITLSANIGQAVPPYDVGKLVETLIKIIKEPKLGNMH